MNSVRSGDVIVITDGREGYLAIDNPADSYRGWHGGPTASESYVPLMFSMPGEAFVGDAGESIDTPPKQLQAATTAVKRDEEGYIRNWHLSPILEAILQGFSTSGEGQ